MSCKTDNPYLNQIRRIQPPRVELAHTPTPLQRMSRVGSELGIELFFKRDDYTGAELSGNKIRKLEYSMAQALDQGADTVITCGGAQSNHCRATALAAARLGLECVLLLRAPDPDNPPALEANSLLDVMSGAEIVWITPEDYARRAVFFKDQAELLRAKGRNPYLIPEGASNSIGAWGYMRCMAELAHDMEQAGVDLAGASVVCATGSGGTAAGLALGKAVLNLPVKLFTVNVCDDRGYFQEVISRICADVVAGYDLELKENPARDLEILDGYVGLGYALSKPDELELIANVARAEGVLLDPVYTGKAFMGFKSEMEIDRARFGKTVVFIHTGGLFGLFPKTAELLPLLA